MNILLTVAVMILWVGTVMYGHMPAFWPIPTSVLGAGTAKLGPLALILGAVLLIMVAGSLSVALVAILQRH